MQELGQKSAGLDTTRKAILTSVNIMHEKVILEEEQTITTRNKSIKTKR